MKDFIVRADHLYDGYGAIVQGELIRCKDCKHWENSPTDITEHICYWGKFRKNADDFCSWAERKEECSR